MKKAVQIGGGNIGRGLNGYLLSKNNFEITFLDISDELVTKLNNANSYDVIQRSDQAKTDHITNFKALNIIKEEASCAKEIADSEIVTISIGISNLSQLAQLFISAFKQHMKKANTNHINIIAVENGINATDALQKAILSQAEKTKKISHHIEKHISFVNCAVDRIVPNQSQKNLNVEVEPFFELVCDKKSWFGPHLKEVKYSPSLDKFIQRKLFMLNATHAFIAWYGIKNGFQYIYEFKNHPILLNNVQKMLDCLVNILSKKFDFSTIELKIYAQKIITRLENKAIKDEVTRVGRGVKRKVAPNDRFMRPLKYALQFKIAPDEIINALAYAFSGLDFADEEVREINQYIRNYSLSAAIQKYTGATPEITSKISDTVRKI